MSSSYLSSRKKISKVLLCSSACLCTVLVGVFHYNAENGSFVVGGIISDDVFMAHKLEEIFLVGDVVLETMLQDLFYGKYFSSFITELVNVAKWSLTNKLFFPMIFVRLHYNLIHRIHDKMSQKTVQKSMLGWLYNFMSFHINLIINFNYMIDAMQFLVNFNSRI